MTHYLLSVHTVEGEARDPMTEEEMQQFMGRVGVLEEEIKSAGAWVFGGALHDPDTATVARVSGDEVLTTDGPFAESKEHLGGFYIIEAEDLDSLEANRGPPVPTCIRGLTAWATARPHGSSMRPRSAGSSARSPADLWLP
jgi:hypothetical protein